MAYVSVIVPTYNSQSVIESCLRAVRASAFQDYELIVVDDASTDDTFSLASKYTENVIKLPLKKGRSCARNSAIKVAKGEIIVNIDSDIIIKPDTIARIIDYFICHPGIDALTGCLDKEHPNQDFFSQYKNLYMHYIFSKLPERVTFLCGSICAFRRKSVQPCYPDVEIAEDTELGQRLVSMGKKIAFLKDLQAAHLKNMACFLFLKMISRFLFPGQRFSLNTKAGNN